MRLFCFERHSSTPPDDAVPSPEPAWRTLLFATDWLKHAETKAVLTLTVDGVGVGVFYNQIKDQQDPSTALIVLSVLFTAAALIGGVLAVMSIRPRLRNGEPATSLIYYAHIDRAFGWDQTDAYVEALRRVCADREQEIREVGQQIHAIAKVAHTKYRWVNPAIHFVIAQMIFLAGIAGLIGYETITG